ncbi:alkylhydroperoxidase [alpha proteobacterium AAP81b]|nr:alkylhydroperoxidase [alpha proteobacterium AAP81b]
MPRIATPDLATLPAASAPILDAVNKSLGVIPNLYRVAGLSPAVLQGMTGLGGALGKSLDVKTRERIALVTAQVNGCDYCLSAHSYLATNLAKLSAEEIAAARIGKSADARANAAVAFAKAVAEARGQVSDADLAAVRLAGFSDAQILEIVAVVVENFFTNFVNNVARTEIDFPVVAAAA